MSSTALRWGNCVVTLCGLSFALGYKLGWNAKPQVEFQTIGHHYSDPDYKSGYHYVSRFGQRIEIRGDHKNPLHMTDEGDVEIEAQGPNKTLIVVHPPVENDPEPWNGKNHLKPKVVDSVSPLKEEE